MAYEFLDFPEKRPGYMGAVGCQTSMCHGGAAPINKQFTVWQQQDPHSKSYATLTTAWSKRIADTLKIKYPAQSPDCTSCHAPLAQVEPARLVSPSLVREGVSCGSCHGPSSEWLLSHTRTDYTRAQRVASGLTDQEDLYIRANTCVACHQEIDPQLLEAGHPKLNYDLAALQQRLPKHWKETSPDAQVWLVGQATSLRESAHVRHLWQEKAKERGSSDFSQAQMKVLSHLSASLSLQTDMSAFTIIPTPQSQIEWSTISTTADLLAKELSDIQWTPELQSKAVAACQNISGTDTTGTLSQTFIDLDKKKSP